MYILAVTTSIGLISPDGQLITTISLADHQIPINTPVIGDFTNDGMNDIIICSAKGNYGFALIKSSGTIG